MVKQWNPETEDLFDNIDKDQIDRIKYNIKEFDQYLGPYPLVPQDKESLNVYHRWVSLTSKISTKTIKMILPENGKISAISSVSRFSDINKPEELKDNEMNETNNATSSTEDNNKNTEENSEKYRIKFTPIELKRSFPKNASVEEVTKYSIDKSYQLKFILDNYYKGDKNLFLGEFQLSYIIFLIGQVYDGFEQWKTIIVMMLQCNEALEQYGETLFTEFLEILNDQLKDFPHDFFYDILSGSNFLRSTIKIFYRIIQDTNGKYPLLEKQLNILLEKLNKTFKWDLRTECYEIDESNAISMKNKINSFIVKGQQQSSKGVKNINKEENNSTNVDSLNETNDKQENKKKNIKTVNIKDQKLQLVKLMEELGIENEEDMPMIVDYDE